jgi:hypothetical protein
MDGRTLREYFNGGHLMKLLGREVLSVCQICDGRPPNSEKEREVHFEICSSLPPWCQGADMKSPPPYTRLVLRISVWSRVFVSQGVFLEISQLEYRFGFAHAG